MRYYIEYSGGSWRGWFYDPDTMRSYSKTSCFKSDLEKFARKNQLKIVYL